MKPPGGPRGGMDLSALAGQLGVSTAKLQAALEAARPAGDPRSHAPGEDPMAAALAEQLGLSTAKVRAALDAVRPAHGPGGARPDGAAPPDGWAPPDGSTAPDGAAPPAASGSTTDATAA